MSTTKAVAEMQAKYETGKKELALARVQIQLEQREAQLTIVACIVALLVISGIFIYRRMVVEARLKSQLATAEAKNLVDQERLRISRELHDNIGAQLTFINHAMGTDESHPGLHELRKITLETIRELRRTVWLINHANIRLEEFVVKVREYLQNDGIIPIEVIAEGELDNELDSHIATNLFRVIQEAVNNAIKHSGASSISVDVVRTTGKLSITIADNGKGFHVSESDTGFGLKNMASRIQSIGGLFDLTSRPGAGTRVRVSL